MKYLTLVFPLATLAFLLLLCSEIAPVLCGGGDLLRGDDRWKKRDSLSVLLITAAYALTAFAGLGDKHAPENFCQFTEQGSYALIELDAPTRLGSVRYYAGLHTGNYYLQVSANGAEYIDAATLEQGHADVFKWCDADISSACGKVQYLRIVSDGPLWMGELALYDADGVRISADTLSYPPGCDTLFDEQTLVPDTLRYTNSTYFDEIYHVRTAYEHIESESPYEISHPPLGKLLLGLGIRLFGLNPFGWRFSGTLIGVLMLPALYLFLKKMFGGTAVPAAVTAVWATDFLHFVQTRIATIDSYAVFFILLMYLFFWLYWRAPREALRDWLPPLALSGLCFGLGAACKWICLYAGAGLGLLWLLDRVFRAKACDGPEKRRGYWRETSVNILWCLLCFVLVPAVVYYLSYYAYGTAKGMHGPGMFFSGDYFRLVLDNQKYMFSYHSGVTATHPYSSVWWQWLLDLRPILYYLEYLPDGRHITIGAIVNPMLCWGGLLAMVCMAYLAACKKDRTALFILIGYLAQLVPWIFVHRIVFEYHYFAATVFLLLAIGYLLRSAQLRLPDWRGILLRFSGVSAVLFLVYYPVLAGTPIAAWYGNRFLDWLGGWPF